MSSMKKQYGKKKGEEVFYAMENSGKLKKVIKARGGDAARSDKAPSVFATCEYGGNVFCAVAKHKNILGLQFHPEKSGHQGLEIITNIINQNVFSL